MVFRERKPSTVHVGNQPNCISFSGCGFLGIYHIGVASCIKQHAPTFLKNIKRVYGCSAGSLIGAMLLNDICCGKACKTTFEIANNIRSRYLGPFSPTFNFCKVLRENFLKVLPRDAHKRVSGKLYISLTRLSDRQNVLVSEYSTLDELIDALLCSCFVPFYSGILPPKYRGVYYVDGGLSNNLPSDADTITVSPWSGASDICPRNDAAESLIDINIVNTSVQMTMKNMYRFSTMFYPPKSDVLSDFCKQGFREALQYLLEHGLLETCDPVSQSVPDVRSLSRDSISEEPNCSLSQSSVKFYLEEESEEGSYGVEGLSEIDSGVSETTSSGGTSETASNMTERLLLDQISAQDVVETDANHNQEFSCSEQIHGLRTTKLKSVKSVTVMQMHPAEERMLILHFTLPLVIVEALEENYMKNTSKSWCQPVSKLISLCGKTLIVRIPLHQSYKIACWLLENVSIIPTNVKWLLNYLGLFVAMLHDYFQVKGTELIAILQDSKETLGEELQVMSYKLGVLVNIIIHHMLEQGCISSLSQILKATCNNSPISKLTGILA